MKCSMLMVMIVTLLWACDAAENDPIEAGGVSTAGDAEGGLSEQGGEPVGGDTPPAGGSQGGASPSSSALSCQYQNMFSRALECKDYSGAGWTPELISDDCAGQPDSTLNEVACPTQGTLGRCFIDEGDARAVVISFPGEEVSACEITATGCVRFARGRFEPSALCEGQFEPVEPPPVEIGAVFEPFELLCVAPEEGEGLSEGGEVCTWRAIGGCTEPGRSFTDFASCGPVLTQRPYAPVPPSGFETPADDPIRQNEAHRAEVEWVRGQAEACGCVCCHSEREAPSGASIWDTDQEGLWTDDFTGRGLAMAAGWLDTSVLGAFPPEDNNGFDRSQTALPTTDPARMIAFFEGELARRGLTRADFEGEAPIGGPLYSQRVFEPSACERGEGVDRNGAVSWVGGEARYIYVLREGSDNPSTPPNLDLPEGTLWRVDVDHLSPAVADGFSYGVLPMNARQAYPLEGNPEALNEGERYYLYVMRDVGVPITRCLFTYGEETTTEPSGPWGATCAEDADCGAPTDYCVKMPGAPEGYCSQHCDSLAVCQEAGAPSDWSCNALNCATEAFTWCGPASEVEESGGFLQTCP